jgi:hypothetical protein
LGPREEEAVRNEDVQNMYSSANILIEDEMIWACSMNWKVQE